MTTGRPTLRNPALQADFERQGYAVVPLLLAADEVTAARAELERLRAASAVADPDGSACHSSFVSSDQVYRRNVHDFVCALLAARLDAILVDYRPLLGTYLCKPPGGGKMHLHRDWTWTTDPEDVAVNVWCPLVDVAESNGALRVVAGSQRLVAQVAAPRVPLYCAGFEERVMAQAVPVSIGAGEALIFDGSILHWSPNNPSRGLRPAANLVCIPNEAKPAFYRFDASNRGRAASRAWRFELFDMSGDAYFEHSMEELRAGLLRAPSLGFVSNRNRALTAAEFDRLLACRRSRQARRPSLGSPFKWARARLARLG